MELFVLKPFNIHYRRNRNTVKPGTVLISEDGEHFRCRGELALLLDAEAVRRLIEAGCLGYRETQIAAE